MCGLNLFFAENAPTCYVNLVAFIKGSKIKLQKKRTKVLTLQMCNLNLGKHVLQTSNHT